MSKYAICLDIGGTKVLGAIFNDKHEIVFRYKRKTKAKEGAQNVEYTIVSVIDDLLVGYGITLEDVYAIAAGAPGVINQETGVVLFAPNLPWANYEIRRMMEERYHIPFYIGNDVNVGVYGEWKYGAARGLSNVAGLFIVYYRQLKVYVILRVIVPLVHYALAVLGGVYEVYGVYKPYQRLAHNV